MIWFSLSLTFFCSRNLQQHVTRLLHCLYRRHRRMLPTELNQASWHQNQLLQKQVLAAGKCNYTLTQTKVAILHADSPGTQFVTGCMKRTAPMSSGCRHGHSFCSKDLVFWLLSCSTACFQAHNLYRVPKYLHRSPTGTDGSKVSAGSVVHL